MTPLGLTGARWTEAAKRREAAPMLERSGRDLSMRIDAHVVGGRGRAGDCHKRVKRPAPAGGKGEHEAAHTVCATVSGTGTGARWRGLLGSVLRVFGM